MKTDTQPGRESRRVAIVDYGRGNLFSVKLACEHVGLAAGITSSIPDLMAADAVILPGVGAFGEAMAALQKADLVLPLREIAASNKPLIGICLGLQLLLSESQEFGAHSGLDIIRGSVIRFESPQGRESLLKVPQVGWNRIHRPPDSSPEAAWSGTPLEGFREGLHQYFVHSFYAVPEDKSVTLSRTTYGHIEFSSSLRKGNVFAFQFHPERSGPDGLALFRNLAAMLQRRIAS